MAGSRLPLGYILGLVDVLGCVTRSRTIETRRVSSMRLFREGGSASIATAVQRTCPDLKRRRGG